jgi:CrcB protein
MTLFSILFFGVLGVLSRYLIGVWVGWFYQAPFPLHTFLINLLGSFLIGAVYVLAMERSTLSPELKLGLMVGFLGGFTTFSSYSLETFRLLEESKYFSAAAYGIASPALGLFCTFLGAAVARQF